MDADCLGLVVSSLSDYRDALSLLMICKKHYYDRPSNWWSSVEIGMKTMVSGAWVPLLETITEVFEGCPLPNAWDEFREHRTTYGFKSITILINNGVYSKEVVEGLEEILNKRYNIYDNECLKACVRNLYGYHADVFIDGDFDEILTCVNNRLVSVSYLVHLICHYIIRGLRAKLLLMVFSSVSQKYRTSLFVKTGALISESISGEDLVTLIDMITADPRRLVMSCQLGRHHASMLQIPEVNTLMIREGSPEVPQSIEAYEIVGQRRPSDDDINNIIRNTTSVDVIRALARDYNIPYEELLEICWGSSRIKSWVLEYLSLQPEYQKINIPVYRLITHLDKIRLEELWILLKKSNLERLELSSVHFNKLITLILEGSEQAIEVFVLMRDKVHDLDSMFQDVSDEISPYLNNDMTKVMKDLESLVSGVI